MDDRFSVWDSIDTNIEKAARWTDGFEAKEVISYGSLHLFPTKTCHILTS
jgi:hypothetical protein